MYFSYYMCESVVTNMRQSLDSDEFMMQFKKAVKIFNHLNENHFITTEALKLRKPIHDLNTRLIIALTDFLARTLPPKMLSN